MKREDKDLIKCNYCNDYPIDPHEIGCKHVYCYYCLMSQFKLGNAFTCFQCKLRINQKEFLKRINLN